VAGNDGLFDGVRVMKLRAHFIAVLITVSVGSAFAADWPGYLGPRRDSTSAEKGILRTWPKEGPKVLWTAPVGVGYGGPVVSGGKVYLLDRDDAVGDKLRVLDFATGRELWSVAYGAPGRFDHPGSRTTPIVDGNNVYSFGPLGDLYCISTTTQTPVWNKNVWKEFGGEQLPRWALTQNPLIYRNLVIVAAQTSRAGVVAYDKLTGELKWKSPALAGVAGYVSPSIVKVGGEDHLVMVMASAGMGRSAGGGAVSGLDPLSGRVLWTYDGWQCRIPVPHAVDAGEGRVLVTGAYRSGAAMFRIQKAAPGTYRTTDVFENPDFGAHTQPPVLYRDHFYAQYTVNERSDGLVCMTIAGQVKWKTGDSPSFNKGGMVLADDLLLATDGNAKLYLIQPDPAGFKPIASAELLSPGENWAPLALADGKLLIRDHRQMKCVQVAQQTK
jgi:outer membrane protein assembly factor BamB